MRVARFGEGLAGGAAVKLINPIWALYKTDKDESPLEISLADTDTSGLVARNSGTAWAFAFVVNIIGRKRGDAGCYWTGLLVQERRFQYKKDGQGEDLTSPLMVEDIAPPLPPAIPGGTSPIPRIPPSPRYAEAPTGPSSDGSDDGGSQVAVTRTGGVDFALLDGLYHWDPPRGSQILTIPGTSDRGWITAVIFRFYGAHVYHSNPKPTQILGAHDWCVGRWRLRVRIARDALTHKFEVIEERCA